MLDLQGAGAVLGGGERRQAFGLAGKGHVVYELDRDRVWLRRVEWVAK